MANQMFVRDCGRERIPILLVSGFLDLRAVAKRIGTPYSAPKPCELDWLLRIVDRALAEKVAPEPQADRPIAGAP